MIVPALKSDQYRWPACTDTASGDFWPEARLDGTGAHVIVSGQDHPAGPAPDAAHLYWADWGAGTIVEANLDGTGAHVIASGQKSPEGIAVDARHLYWANNGAGMIVEARLDGTGAHVIASGQGRAVGVVVGPR